MPLTMRIAAPAPACVAAPAGAIGSEADAAEAHRNASASGIELPTESALSRTNTATARSAQETEIRNQASDAERRHAACSRSQRPTLKRVTKARLAILGRKRTSPAAATPASATRAKPTRTPPDSVAAAATEASGANAALSNRPTTISVRQIAPRPAVLPGRRRTTAILI